MAGAPARVRLLPILFGVSAALTALILATILRPGYLLYRDAVSTPRSFVTDSALGLGDIPARAVPQDWLVAMASQVVDGGALVTAILFLGLTLAGVGYGRLAARLVPAAGRSGAVAATVASIWNPYVAERLLQGHWSLLVSYAALGWIAVAATEVRAGGRRGWWALVAAVTLAGFTPTGSVLAAILLAVSLIAALVRARRWGGLATAAAIWLVGAAPWLTATVVGSAPATAGSSGFEVFGIRAEPGLGTVGTALGLGGIWNSDAVPASRTIWWAAVATTAFLVVVAAGTAWWWRHRQTLDASIGPLGALALATVAAVCVAAIPAVAAGLSTLAHDVPGVGLFRDTQKYLALTMPFVAVAAAAAVTGLRRWVPAGFALGVTTLLVVAPLPDLAWGVGGKLSTVHYPPDWAAVAGMIPADAGAVAVWPPGTVRRYRFADTVSLNPLPRMVRATVVDSGRLTVDGVAVDPGTGRGAEVDAALRRGGRAADLAALGVGWVVVENNSPPSRLSSTSTSVYRGADLTLYRIPGPIAASGASSGARAAVIAAHVAWVLATLGGLGGVWWSRRRRRR